MFNFGIQELALIFVVALLVFGPKRLPEIARTMGKGIGELKRALDGVKSQINSELHDIKDVKELKDLDPISLKNELFKAEDLFKIDEDKPTAPSKAAEQPAEQAIATAKQDSDKTASPSEQSTPPPVSQDHKGGR